MLDVVVRKVVVGVGEIARVNDLFNNGLKNGLVFFINRVGGCKAFCDVRCSFNW
jgi:hypothetical protein